MTEPKCTDKILTDFGFEHYTYINQIFGDESVKKIIQELYPSDTFELIAKKVDADFENHHILLKKAIDKKELELCSIEMKYQDIPTNKKDMLCQSYSLIAYYKLLEGVIQDHDDEIELKKELQQYFADPIKRQMKMIAMYRALLQNPQFVEKLDSIFSEENETLWTDYTITRRRKDTESFIPFLQREGEPPVLLKSVEDWLKTVTSSNMTTQKKKLVALLREQSTDQKEKVIDYFYKEEGLFHFQPKKSEYPLWDKKTHQIQKQYIQKALVAVKYILWNRKQEILEKIRETLDHWEAYGYKYFIGDGKCGSLKKKKTPDQSLILPGSRRTRGGRRLGANKSKKTYTI